MSIFDIIHLNSVVKSAELPHLPTRQEKEMHVAFLSYETPSAYGKGTFLSAPIQGRMEINTIFDACRQQIATNLGVAVDEIHVLSFSLLPAVINDDDERKI